jgi:Rieske Fe-S protein
MPMTRRRFTIATASTLALATIGCDGQASQHEGQAADSPDNGPDKKEDHKAKLATEPFLIGPPGLYAKAGVYDGFKKDKGVWVISDGRVLVALSATCTHLACSTQFDTAKEKFTCPCHKSSFGFDGIQQTGSKAKRPLERCSLRIVDGAQGSEVEVDPTHRFRMDQGQWDDPASSLQLT